VRGSAGDRQLPAGTPGARDQRDVAREESTLDGVFERAADDEVDLVHRLGRERSPVAARVEQLVVEGFEMVRPEPSKSHPTERGDDVVVDVAPIAVVGRRSEHDPLAWEPPAHEEGTEGEAPHLVVASLEFSCQASRQPFSVFAARTCWMPASALFAGDRVDAFVDDGVPAVAL
jgi:hypothetical protein